MSAQEVEIVSTLPAVRERSSVLLAPVMDVNTALKRLEEFQQFCANYLQESKDGGLDGGDYGVIPGAGQKKVLMKSGADKLCEIYGLYDEYVVMSTVEDWEKGLFDYTLKCVLKSRRDDSMVGSGVGSCSSFESKYRWRDQKRKCPACGKETIIRGKDWNTGKPQGWVCWQKAGRSDGCNTKFKDGDKSIEDQVQGRVENPDIIDSKNTVLKMAKKRAKIDAVIGVTRSSGIFTQDLDDLPPVPPSKPPVPVTEEDIPLKAAGAASGPVAAAIVDNNPTPEIQYCSKAENTSFFANIRKALPAELQAHTETIGRDWLKHKGYHKKSGEGSLQGVDKAMFPELMRECLEYIKTVEATVKP
jgi:hypothetical protein